MMPRPQGAVNDTPADPTFCVCGCMRKVACWLGASVGSGMTVESSARSSSSKNVAIRLHAPGAVGSAEHNTDRKRRPHPRVEQRAQQAVDPGGRHITGQKSGNRQWASSVVEEFVRDAPLVQPGSK